MRALVTGGAGFIGSNLVDALLERGDEVVLLDNFSTGFRENLAQVDGHVEMVEGDIRSYERVHNAVRGCEVVFHQAALPSVPRSIQDPLTTNEVNVAGTLNVVLAARDAGVRRLVFASSSSIYGNAPGGPRRETMAISPKAPYAVAKLAGEQYCRVAHEVYGLETVGLRYFNVFGPRQNPFSQYSAVIPLFIKALHEERSPTIFGDGEQARDFTYVANAVEANMQAGDADGCGGTVLNIACGEKHSINELAQSLNEILGTDLQPEHTDPRPGDVRESLADISAAAEAIGYRPRVDFTEGLRLTVDAFLESVGGGAEVLG